MTVPTFNLVNGAKFPAVGLGTFTVTDDKVLEQTIDKALENGYRHIDTAFYYKNEAIIGRTLKKWFDSGKLKREEVFVTTKLPIQGVHPDRVEKYLKLSLEGLQLEYVDLYLIHFPVCIEDKPGFDVNPQPTDLVAVWKKLEEQVRNGRCKAIGVSNFNQDQVQRILNSCTIKPAANQVELTVYLQQPKLVQFLQDNQIVPISYSSLGNPGFGEFVRKTGRPDSHINVENVLEDPTVATIAKKYQKSPAQILLKFLVQTGIAIIPKSTNENRLRENINLFDFTLKEADMQLLKQLDKKEAGRKSKWNVSEKLINADEYPWK